MPRQADVAIEDLLPYQAYVGQSGLRKYERLLRKGLAVPEVHVLAFPLDSSVGGILLDGIHRSRSAFNLGRRVVAAYIHENDEDLRAADFLSWLQPTAESIRLHYLQKVNPYLRSMGIWSIGDVYIDESW